MEIMSNLRKRKLENLTENELPKKPSLFANGLKIEIKMKSDIKDEVIDDKEKVSKCYLENKSTAILNCTGNYCNTCTKYYPDKYCSHLTDQNILTPFIKCDQTSMEECDREQKYSLRNFCNECHKKFPSRSKLDAHFRMHSSNENKKLLACGHKCSEKHSTDCKDVVDNGKLECKNNKRNRSDTKKQSFPCNECNESFPFLVHLAKHISIVHRLHHPSKTECPICKKIVSAIDSHLRTHQDSPMDCNICGVSLKNYSALKAHIRCHNILAKDGRDRAIVPRGDKRIDLTLKSPLKSHVDECLFPCPRCEDSSCSSMNDLIKHMSNKHRSIPDNYSQCPYCADIVSDLESHMAQHSLAPYHCEMCPDTSFADVTDLRKHLTRKHRRRNAHRHYIDTLSDKYKNDGTHNYKRVSCLICQSTIRVCHTITHINNNHRPIFKCKQCGKLLASLDALTHHRYNHNNNSNNNNKRVQTIICALCSHSFVSHIRLMAHLMAVHRTPFSASRSCSRC